MRKGSHWEHWSKEGFSLSFAQVRAHNPGMQTPTLPLWKEYCSFPWMKPSVFHLLAFQMLSCPFKGASNSLKKKRRKWRSQRRWNEKSYGRKYLYRADN